MSENQPETGEPASPDDAQPEGDDQPDEGGEGGEGNDDGEGAAA